MLQALLLKFWGAEKPLAGKEQASFTAETITLFVPLGAEPVRAHPVLYEKQRLDTGLLIRAGICFPVPLRVYSGFIR